MSLIQYFQQLQIIILIILSSTLINQSQSTEILSQQLNGSTDLTDLRPPRITEHPSDTIVGRNEPTKLDCRAEGNPNLTIEWYKDGEKIGKRHNRLILPTGSLFFLHVIHNKKDPDTGTYWCVARNEIGKATSRNATLNYAFLREEFKTLPKSQAIVSGDRVTLDCVPPRGYPEPKVYWAKDGRPVSLSTNRIKLIPGGSLRINDVRPNDAGRYTCIAENLIGTKESPPAILEVSVKPYFIRNPENVSALSGETIEFSCKVGGEPAPYITWTKKDGKIAIGRIQIKEDKTLRIREVKPSDSGIYICEAVNQGGHISSSASLSVDCIPNEFIGSSKADQVPTHSPENLRLTVINETSTTLSWSPLSSDQWKGEPKAYFIRLMSSDHRFCSHYNTSSPYQTELILNNLIYGETYEIIVAALTLSGLGSFTEPIPLHMVTSYSYNWRTPNGLSSSSLSPLSSLTSSSSPSSPSSSLSELLLKDTTILAPSNITKEPIFIFSAILALFVLSFIILILFARRHINWNKGMGAYITVQLNNKCDELSDTKFAKSNTGVGGGGGSNVGNRGVLAQSTIGNPSYWLTDKKLSTFTSTASSMQQQQQQSSSSSTNVQPPTHSISPKPVGQDYSVQSDQTINSQQQQQQQHHHHHHHHQQHHLNHHHYNDTMDGESDEEGRVMDEDDDGYMESDYAEVEERTLKTFGKRDYSSPSTEPYATTTLMKSFRGSSENTSLLDCPPSSNIKPINLINNKRGTGRLGGGVINGKKLNVSAVSLNTGVGSGGNLHRLSSSSSTTRSNNISNGNNSYGKPLTIESKITSGQHHLQHLRTNHLNSSATSASSSASSSSYFNHHHHLSTSLANQNILNSQSSLPQSTLTNDSVGDTLITPSTGKSTSSNFSQQSTNYSNGNLLNGSNRLLYQHHLQQQQQQQQHHHHIINNNGSSESTSDLVNDVNSSHSRSSSLSSSSTINHNIGNRDNSRSTDLTNKQQQQQQQPTSNVTVHCQYHPIVLASPGSYFEKYL